MDFDWMSVELPMNIRERNAERRANMARSAVRARAAMLRRLGYDKAYAKHRLLGDQRWAWELVPGATAITEKQLRAEIDAAFAR